jgi:hypothetical protein
VQAHEARFSDADWARVVRCAPDRHTLCPLKKDWCKS